MLWVRILTHPRYHFQECCVTTANSGNDEKGIVEAALSNVILGALYEYIAHHFHIAVEKKAFGPPSKVLRAEGEMILFRSLIRKKPLVNLREWCGSECPPDFALEPRLISFPIPTYQYAVG